MIATTIVSLALAGAAQNYDTQYFDIRELNGAEGCAISGNWAYEGRSNIYLQIDMETDSDVDVSISSYGWSQPKSDDTKLMGFAFTSPGQQRKAMTFYAGALAGTRPGMLAEIPADERVEFLQAFSDSSLMEVYIVTPVEDGDVDEKMDLKLVLEANLTGSSAATASANRCVANVKRREDARRAREARVDHITKDPFAD